MLDSGKPLCVSLSSPDNGVQGAADDPDEPEDFNFLSGSSEMDLLGEIFDTLSTQTCQERGLLYGTRSLDLFSSDSSDYIQRVSPVSHVAVLKARER